MTFHEFAEGTRGAVEAAVKGMRGERALTPAIHLDTELGVQILGLGSEFFSDAVSRGRLLEYVRPLLAAYGARQAAWSFFAEVGSLFDSRREAADHAIVVVVERERTECWMAPLHRYPNQPPALGVWTQAEPNMQVGVLIDIQEDLR